MGLKDYQIKLLDDFESFLARTRELKDPSLAFAESTKEAFGFSLPYHPFPGAESIPYVCMRVPTGGGKTRIAGHAIARVNKAFLPTDYSLVLWLVPSEPIREQTLYALKTKGEMLNGDMRNLFGNVHVLDISEALYVQPATLNTGNTIVVATMQSFKREADAAEELRVKRQNGALMPHFNGVSGNQIGNHSLVDVIRLRQPFIIVDEAHNQGSPLAVETLAGLNPSCILELTATPDRNNQPSNVIRSVSAATLQAEDMLKLPLELAVHPEWRVSLREAIARLRQLDDDAKKEQMLTGEIINPVVMLIQAERRDAHRETFTPERVRQILIDDFNIRQADKIAIATGALDELSGKKLGDGNYPQFIITVDKLREGWDCPFAYVLFSFRNTTSATAVEQVLGRVLRMPHVKRKQIESLNRSYAYVVSSELVKTVQGLRDGLVQSGFERLDARELIQTKVDDHQRRDLFTAQSDLVVPLPEANNALVLPDETALASLQKGLRDRIEISPESGTLTVKGGASAEQIKIIADVFSAPEAQKTIRERLDTMAAVLLAPPAREMTPAENGEKAIVPLLGIMQRSFFEVFSESMLLDASWEISDFDCKLTDAEFSHDVEAMRRAQLSISQLETIECDVFDRMDSQLALLSSENGWEVTDLVYWLDRQLHFPYSDRDQKVAWINDAITHLLDDRKLTLDELAYRKFRLRGALERKLAAGLVEAKQTVFEKLFDDESVFSVRDEHAVVLEQGRYAYDTPYAGLIRLKKHYFPVVGNLKPSGEEFECAEYIANQLPNIEWWVRNVERKPTSFWLQTASDRFYPDFIVRLKDGVTLAVEYKGSHIADGRDSIEKKRIGELWAKRSNGKCRFVWVENRNWQVLSEAVK